MDPMNQEHAVAYTIDEYTNHFLADYPIHCEFRTIALGQHLLHSHSGFEFYLVVQGTGSYIVGDRLYPLYSGTLTVIRPNVIHRPFANHGQELPRYVVSIDESYLKHLNAIFSISKLSIDQLLTGTNSESCHYFLSVQQLNQVQTLLSELEQALHSKMPNYELTVLKYISDFLIQVIGLIGDPNASGNMKSENERIIGDVLSFLITHYQENLQIEDLLQLFPVSRSQLFTLFKEATGNTIKQFLTEYRLNKVKQLLAGTDLSVTEIASLTGFGDMSHFFNVFKKHTNLSPKQYRMKAQHQIR